MFNDSSDNMLQSELDKIDNILNKSCYDDWPQWECFAANIAGLMSTAVWFIVLFPQVIKNFHRKSVSGLSFLWAVANFTASLVNLFFAFSIRLPLYVRVSAVYMPCLELTILFQFLIYSQKPFTSRLLALLVCLIIWGSIIELELNLPQSRDKIQWVAIALWSIETFPQVILNIRLQSTSGQATTSIFITIFGKTTDFLVTYGLNMPLPYVVMCYFSSSSAFINGFQVFLYGKDSWVGDAKTKTKALTSESINSDESLSLLKDAATSSSTQHRLSNSSTSNGSFTSSDNTRSSLLLKKIFQSENRPKTCRYWCVLITRCICMTYISVLLVVFAMGLIWRTRSFFALLGPVACFTVVFTASEYYRLKYRGYLKRCEDVMERRVNRGRAANVGTTLIQ